MQDLDIDTLLHILLLGGLILASAFFSSSEAAFFSLRRLRLKELEGVDPIRGRLGSKLLERPQRLLFTILIGNEFVNVAATVVATSLALSFFGDKGVGIAIAFMVPTILIFGELLPKSIGVTRAEGLVPFLSPPLEAFCRITTPIRRVIKFLVERVLPLLGPSHQAGPFLISEDEFKTLIEIGRREGSVRETESDIIQKVLKLGEIKVREIMTPRMDMFCLEVNTPLEEVIEKVRERRYSRIPVFEGSLDQIVGILNVKDLMTASLKSPPPRGLRELLHPALFVPETKRLDAMLKEFQKRRRHMAIVVDEYGGTAGLVTLEDLLEELVGEISDEFDPQLIGVVPLDSSSYRVSAMLGVDEFNKALEGCLPEDEADTIGGLVLHLFGRVPAKGESVAFMGFEFTIEKMRGNRILELMVRKRQDSPSEVDMSPLEGDISK